MAAPANGAARGRIGCAFCQKTFRGRCVMERGAPPMRDPTHLRPGCEGWAYERSRGVEGLDGRGRGAVTFVA